jgi:hypothetical protein
MIIHSLARIALLIEDSVHRKPLLTGIRGWAFEISGRSAQI